ncbi:alpha/beta fold hydrolase [Caulobacter segnis]|uniref:alpha/beta fold hydrolase n=1 Tax=Caulobacter segnis TaxID=88688 RepID=UPI001CBB7DE4|nr:alpha/beta hydrolase [Caulobacter segnis]UAL10178.1 alpha/beta hydrolase [Caulobacter segnis]
MLAMPIKTLRLERDGLAFDALTCGVPEDPLVLFLHGFPQFAWAWTPILQAVAGAGFWAVAVDQRGYADGARPPKVADYHIDRLVEDVFGFADGLGARRFHLVGHDWGGILAWRAAADHPERLLSLSVISTPHTDAMLEAIAHDPAQTEMSAYIGFFRLPDGAAEAGMLSDGAARLRSAYRGMLDPEDLERHVERLSRPGVLTAALNWYRALDFEARIGPVAVDTLFVWGSADHALGPVAAAATADYVTGPYRFERLEGASHWLLEERVTEVAQFLLEHLGQARAKAA